MKSLIINSITPRYFPDLHAAEVYAVMQSTGKYALIPQEAIPGEDGERRFTIDVRQRATNDWLGFIGHAQDKTLGEFEDADTGKKVEVRVGPGGLLMS